MPFNICSPLLLETLTLFLQICVYLWCCIKRPRKSNKHEVILKSDIALYEGLIKFYLNARRVSFTDFLISKLILAHLTQFPSFDCI